MVSESRTGVMSACADFTQNAWKKELCVNCQRPRTEHMEAAGLKTTTGETNNTSQTPATDSPKPAKRNSLMTKSWTLSQAGEKGDENDEDKWAAMCLPTAEPLDKSYVRREHCYEDIDGESMKHDDKVNVNSDKSVTTSKVKETKKKSVEDRSSTFLQDSNKLGGARSRSSSREKSPAPALKPKPVLDKPKPTDDKDNCQANSDKKSELSPKSRKKLKKNQKSLSFVADKPEIIGDDGGIDNLYLDGDDDSVVAATGDTEVLEFTEAEKDWALQALKNTIWNTEHIGADQDKNTQVKHSKEYEDVQIQSLLQSDRFANVSDCDPLPDKQNFGTFPLRTKSEKSAIDNMFTGNRLSTLSETLENVADTSDDTQSKYDSVMKFLNGGKLDNSSPKRAATDGDNKLDERDISEQCYDDPWGDKFGLDTESEMNLLDEIKGEIDLDSSNAGFALVDLLNDVLAKYSTGSPSETDSVANLDGLDNGKTDKNDGKEKPSELEAKMVTLAASLRKQRAKGRAPRPPSCPPQPPPDGATSNNSKSPAKQLELRAAQSKEPTFKMVPLGKPIGSSNSLSQSVPNPSVQKAETLTLSSSTPENMEGYKIKMDKEKEKQKKGGGIGGFFSRILRRGKDSDSDLLASSETLTSQTGSDVQSDSDNQSDKGSNSDKKAEGGKERRSSKSSPQMKLKVLPGRPQSPKGGHSDNKPTAKVTGPDKKETVDAESNDSKSSPKPQKSKSKDTLNEPSSQPLKPDLPKIQLSPNKASDKDVLAVSPKSKEAPPLPLNPPREISEPVPKPRVRGNSDGGPPRSRPRTRDMTDSKPREMPSMPPPKPPVAAKPRPPSIQTKSLDITDVAKTASPKKEPLCQTSSLEDEVSKSKASQDAQTKVDPKVLRKRAKSPKRIAAPAAPVRASMPNILAETSTSTTTNSIDASTTSLPATVASAARADSKVPFAKELELKLSKDQHQAVNEVRKISIPAPPPSPPISKPDNGDIPKTNTKDKDITKDTEKPKGASRDDLKLSPPIPENPKAVTPEPDTTQTIPAAPDIPIQPEKIELPRAAGNSRKSFLGKLNRKNKPPPPPSVKRTKSITEASISAEHHLKKIDVKDISGPVVSYCCINPFLNMDVF